MSLRGELDLELGKFNSKLAQAVNNAEDAGRKMKRATSGTGEALGTRLVGNVGGDLAGVIGLSGGLVAGAAAAGAAFKALLNDVDDLADRAVRLRETPETLQRVEGAAKLSGVGVDQLNGAVLKLEKNLGDVENKAAADALASFGLTAEHIAGLPLDQKIVAISGAFQEARNDGRGFAEIMDLIGKSGIELASMLEMPVEELKELMGSVNVLSNAAVAQMAAANDRIDAFLQNMGTSAKKAAYDFLNLGEVLGKVLNGSSFDDAFADIQIREGEALTKMEDLERQRKERAEGVARGRQEKADADAAKAAEEKGKKDDKGLSDAKAKVAERKFNMLDDPEKLEAISDQLRKVFEDMHKKGGLWFDQTTEGLGRWAEALEKMGSKELAADALRMQERALELKQEAAKITESQEKTAADEAKKQEEEASKLRKQTEGNAFKMLSPQEQTKNLREQLSKSFGVEIKSGSDIQAGLDKLQKQADDARNKGDKAGEIAALEKLNEAQQDVGTLAGLSRGGSRAAVAGETTSALSVLTGSGSSLVLDEAKQSGQTLREIERILRNIETNSKADPFSESPRDGGFGTDIF